MLIRLTPEARQFKAAGFLSAVIIFITTCQNPSAAISFKDKTKSQNEAVLKNVAIPDKSDEEWNRFRGRYGRCLTKIHGFTGDWEKGKILGLTAGRGDHAIRHQLAAYFPGINCWRKSTSDFNCSCIVENFQNAGRGSTVIDNTPFEQSEANSVSFNYEPRSIDFDGEEGGLQFSESALGNLGAAVVGLPQQKGRGDKEKVESNEKPIGDLISRVFLYCGP